jgi:hypothetical protein
MMSPSPVTAALPRSSVFRVDPRKWTTYHFTQAVYILVGVSEVAVSSTILRHITPRFTTVTAVEIEYTKAPALLFTIIGIIDLVVGVLGYSGHVELLSRGIHPVKTVKLVLHMITIIGTYYAIAGLYASAAYVSVLSSLVPLVISGLMLLALDYSAFYITLLRTHQVRIASRFELQFPLAISLTTFASAQVRTVQ